ncbi:MAG: hypothetical protein ABSA18_17945, partial [Dehalococcoidia bacterium]
VLGRVPPVRYLSEGVKGLGHGQVQFAEDPDGPVTRGRIDNPAARHFGPAGIVYRPDERGCVYLGVIARPRLGEVAFRRRGLAASFRHLRTHAYCHPDNLRISLVTLLHLPVDLSLSCP